MPDQSKFAYQCQNCDWGTNDDQHVSVEIDDLVERVAGGELMPYGQCRKCGSLVSGPIDDATKEAVIAHLRTAGWRIEDVSERVVISDKPYPGKWDKKASESYDAYMKRTEKLWKAIDQTKVINFQIADGYASYFVSAGTPLVLAHIPYGDGYRASDDTLNGLTVDRVKDMLGQSEGLAEVFSAKPASTVHENFALGEILSDYADDENLTFAGYLKLFEADDWDAIDAAGITVFVDYEHYSGPEVAKRLEALAESAALTFPKDSA